MTTSGGAHSQRGVLTACDSHYFPGLLSLHASVQISASCPVLCYDLGLTHEQRVEATRRANLEVLDLPPDELIEELKDATRRDAPMLKPGKRLWPLWICPLLISAAPLRDVVWIDCDAVVLRGLEELFTMLDGGPVFTPGISTPALTANDPELYRLLPIERSFDRERPLVNGGVSAWRRGRDDAVLDAYILPVAAAAHSSAVREAIAWHDQGALIWAIQSLGLEHRVLSSAAWNFPAGHAGLPAEMLAWDDGLLARLQTALPDVMILHWNGLPVPWT